MIRRSICAGSWYPISKPDIDSYLHHNQRKRKAIAAVCPHAGWVYSGKTAGLVYSCIEPSDVYVLIGPNHTGLGSAVSVFSSGEWETPLGNVRIEEVLAQAILKASTHAKADEQAHQKEHSLEVQLPFIRFTSPKAKIVPITMGDYRPSVCKELGIAIAQALKETTMAEKTTLIASSDMSHYIAATEAKRLDTLAIEKIIHMDPDGLLKTVKENRISMCGSGPVATVLWAAKELGATKAELLKYSTSGDVSGDTNQVVGYASLIIT